MTFSTLDSCVKVEQSVVCCLRQKVVFFFFYSHRPARKSIPSLITSKASEAKPWAASQKTSPFCRNFQYCSDSLKAVCLRGGWSHVRQTIMRSSHKYEKQTTEFYFCSSAASADAWSAAEKEKWAWAAWTEADATSALDAPSVLSLYRV